MSPVPVKVTAESGKMRFSAALSPPAGAVLPPLTSSDPLLVTVKGLDREGRAIELRLRDFPARVAQHETDHLDGVLFLDRMTSMQSLTYLEEYSRYHADDND